MYTRGRFSEKGRKALEARGRKAQVWAMGTMKNKSKSGIIEPEKHHPAYVKTA